MGANTLRVLVVDDNKDAADTLARLLSIFGHQTAVAYDGLAGLRAAEADRPDVVLLDVGMPGLDGWELARRIRALWDDSPLLVAVSGYGTKEDHERSRDAGLDAHLVKPADPRVLLRLLEGHAQALRV